MFLGCEGVTEIAEAEQRAALGRCSAHGGTPIGAEPVAAWMERRFDFSAVENRLNEPSGIAETIEVSHRWDGIAATYRALKAALAPHAAEVLGHFSHAYPQGTSLYMIVLDAAPEQGGADAAAAEATLRRIWEIALTTALEAGAAVAHHHGAGIARLPVIREGLGTAMTVLERGEGRTGPASHPLSRQTGAVCAAVRVMSCLVALDAGASEIKASVFASDGRERGGASRDCPSDAPAPGWAQCGGEVLTEWPLQVLRDAIAAAGVRPDDIEAIGVTGSRATVLPVGAHGSPAGPVIFWYDRRAQAQAAALERTLGAERFLALTGNSPRSHSLGDQDDVAARAPARGGCRRHHVRDSSDRGAQPACRRRLVVRRVVRSVRRAHGAQLAALERRVAGGGTGRCRHPARVGGAGHGGRAAVAGGRRSRRHRRRGAGGGLRLRCRLLQDRCRHRGDRHRQHLHRHRRRPGSDHRPAGDGSAPDLLPIGAAGVLGRGGTAAHRRNRRTGGCASWCPIRSVRAGR